MCPVPKWKWIRRKEIADYKRKHQPSLREFDNALKRIYEPAPSESDEWPSLMKPDHRRRSG